MIVMVMEEKERAIANIRWRWQRDGQAKDGI